MQPGQPGGAAASSRVVQAMVSPAFALVHRRAQQQKTASPQRPGSPRPSEPSTSGRARVAPTYSSPRHRGASPGRSSPARSPGRSSPVWRLVQVDDAPHLDEHVPFSSDYTRATCGHTNVHWDYCMAETTPRQWMRCSDADACTFEAAFQGSADEFDAGPSHEWGTKSRMCDMATMRVRGAEEGEVWKVRRVENDAQLRDIPQRFTEFSRSYLRRLKRGADVHLGGFFCGTTERGTVQGCEAIGSCSTRGGHVWTGERDGTIRIWDSQTGKKLRTTDQKKDVFCTCLLEVPCTESMWLGFTDSVIRVVSSVHPYETRISLKRHAVRTPIHALAPLDPEVSKVVSAGGDGQLLLWESDTYLCVRSFTGHTNAVRCCLADGGLLYSGGDDCTVRVWQLYEKGGTEVWKGHTGGVRQLIKTDHHVWTGSEDGSVRVWNASTGACVKVLADPHRGSITAVAYLGDKVWTSCNSEVFLWDAEQLSDEPLARYSTSHDGYVNSILRVHQCLLVRVWTTGQDGTVKVWDSECAADFNPGEKVRERLQRNDQELSDLRERLRAREQRISELASGEALHSRALREENDQLKTQLCETMGALGKTKQLLAQAEERSKKHTTKARSTPDEPAAAAAETDHDQRARLSDALAEKGKAEEKALEAQLELQKVTEEIRAVREVLYGDDANGLLGMDDAASLAHRAQELCDLLLRSRGAAVKLRDAADDSMQLRRELAEANRAVSAAEQAKREAERTRKDTTAKFAELEHAARAAEGEVQERVRNEKELRTKLSTLQANHAEAVRTHSELKRHISQLSDQKTAVERDASQLRRRLTDLGEQPGPPPSVQPQDSAPRGSLSRAASGQLPASREATRDVTSPQPAALPDVEMIAVSDHLHDTVRTEASSKPVGILRQRSRTSVTEGEEGPELELVTHGDSRVRTVDVDGEVHQADPSASSTPQHTSPARGSPTRWSPGAELSDGAGTPQRGVSPGPVEAAGPAEAAGHRHAGKRVRLRSPAGGLADLVIRPGVDEARNLESARRELGVSSGQGLRIMDEDGEPVRLVHDEVAEDGDYICVEDGSAQVAEPAEDEQHCVSITVPDGQQLAFDLVPGAAEDDNVNALRDMLGLSQTQEIALLDSIGRAVRLEHGQVGNGEDLDLVLGQTSAKTRSIDPHTELQVAGTPPGGDLGDTLRSRGAGPSTSRSLDASGRGMADTMRSADRATTAQPADASREPSVDVRSTWGGVPKTVHLRSPDGRAVDVVVKPGAQDAEALDAVRGEFSLPEDRAVRLLDSDGRRKQLVHAQVEDGGFYDVVVGEQDAKIVRVHPVGGGKPTQLSVPRRMPPGTATSVTGAVSGGPTTELSRWLAGHASGVRLDDDQALTARDSSGREHMTIVYDQLADVSDVYLNVCVMPPKTVIVREPSRDLKVAVLVHARGNEERHTLAARDALQQAAAAAATPGEDGLKALSANEKMLVRTLSGAEARLRYGEVQSGAEYVCEVREMPPKVVRVKYADAGGATRHAVASVAAGRTAAENAQAVLEAIRRGAGSKPGDPPASPPPPVVAGVTRDDVLCFVGPSGETVSLDYDTLPADGAVFDAVTDPSPDAVSVVYVERLKPKLVSLQGPDGERVGCVVRAGSKHDENLEEARRALNAGHPGRVEPDQVFGVTKPETGEPVRLVYSDVQDGGVYTTEATTTKSKTVFVLTDKPGERRKVQLHAGDTEVQRQSALREALQGASLGGVSVGELGPDDMLRFEQADGTVVSPTHASTMHCRQYRGMVRRMPPRQIYVTSPAHGAQEHKPVVVHVSDSEQIAREAIEGVLGHRTPEGSDLVLRDGFGHRVPLTHRALSDGVVYTCSVEAASTPPTAQLPVSGGASGADTASSPRSPLSSSQNRVAATGSLFRAPSGACLRIVQASGGLPIAVRGVASSVQVGVNDDGQLSGPDGKPIHGPDGRPVVIGADGSVHEQETGQPLRLLSGEGGSVVPLRVGNAATSVVDAVGEPVSGPDGRPVVVSDDGVLRTQSGVELRMLARGADAVAVVDPRPRDTPEPEAAAAAPPRERLTPVRRVPAEDVPGSSAPAIPTVVSVPPGQLRTPQGQHIRVAVHQSSPGAAPVPIHRPDGTPLMFTGEDQEYTGAVVTPGGAVVQVVGPRGGGSVPRPVAGAAEWPSFDSSREIDVDDPRITSVLSTASPDLMMYHQMQEEKYAKLGQASADVHDRNGELEAENVQLSEKVDNLTHILALRPQLVSIVFDLYKMCVQCRKGLDRFSKEVSDGARSRTDLLSRLAATTADVTDIMNGEKWLLANMFTEDELLHIGASANFFLPDGKRFCKHHHSPGSRGVAPLGSGRWMRLAVDQSPTHGRPGAEFAAGRPSTPRNRRSDSAGTPRSRTPQAWSKGVVDL